MTKYRFFTINQAMRGYIAGSKIRLEVNENDIPLDPFWRRRLRDAAIDGSIAMIHATSSKPADRDDKPQSDKKETK